MGKGFWSNIVTSSVQKSVTVGFPKMGGFVPPLAVW